MELSIKNFWAAQGKPLEQISVNTLKQGFCSPPNFVL